MKTLIILGFFIFISPQFSQAACVALNGVSGEADGTIGDGANGHCCVGLVANASGRCKNDICYASGNSSNCYSGQVSGGYCTTDGTVGARCVSGQVTANGIYCSGNGTTAGCGSTGQFCGTDNTCHTIGSVLGACGYGCTSDNTACNGCPASTVCGGNGTCLFPIGGSCPNTNNYCTSNNCSGSACACQVNGGTTQNGASQCCSGKINGTTCGGRRVITVQ